MAMMTHMLLSLLFVSGALAACRRSALLITAPTMMEALSGSCLQIPCNFSAQRGEEFDSTRETSGVWIKEHPNFRSNLANVIFNSSGSVTTYPMNITGNLNQKNCTTLFSRLITDYTNVYFFRVENQNQNQPFMASAVCDPVNITVRDSPLKPTIEISGDLVEKKSVTITCSAFTPCPQSPPELTWSLQQHPHNFKEETSDRRVMTKIQKTITLSDKDDGLNISCSARYPVYEGKDVKTAEERKTLNVSYAPKDTLASISPLGSVSAGRWVNLTCSSRANPPVFRFTWFKKSKDGPIMVSEGDLYSISATDREIYYCVATNRLGNQTSTAVQLPNGETDSSSTWGAVVGGIIVLIGAVAAIWWIKSKHRTSQITSQPKQDLKAEEPVVQEPARVTEANDIHYGEIDFSKRRPEASSVHDGGQQQDTLYAQINVSQPAKSSKQTSDGPDDLYAEVKKK